MCYMYAEDQQLRQRNDANSANLVSLMEILNHMLSSTQNTYLRFLFVILSRFYLAGKY